MNESHRLLKKTKDLLGNYGGQVAMGDRLLYPVTFMETEIIN
jgi:hypothetical protein